MKNTQMLIFKKIFITFFTLAHLGQLCAKTTIKQKKTPDLRLERFQILPLTPTPQPPMPQTVYARQGAELCQDEQEALNARKHIIKQALKEICGEEVEDKHLPKIGVVCSGGGYRSMIATTGLLTGLEKTGVLKATSYISTLSGSSWAVFPWLAHAKSLSWFKDYLRTQTTEDLHVKNFNWGAIVDILFSKLNAGQAVNLADVWGGLLADVLLDGLPSNGQRAYLSHLAPLVKSGAYPIPIVTTVADGTTPYEWFEHTPFEVGSFTSKVWIPSWTFGKRYSHGLTNDSSPEQTLGFTLGASGSAWAINFKDILSKIFDRIDSLFFDKCASFTNLLHQIGELQLPAPTVFNFMRGVPGNEHTNDEYLTLIDAGIACELPMPPMMNRNINLYIICDASSNVGSKHSNAMRDAQRHANDNGLKFPTIDYNKVVNDKASVFCNENDPETPIIVYFPNKANFSTLKFEYTYDEYNELYRGMKDNVETSKDILVKAIKCAVNNMKKIENNKTAEASQA